MKMQCVKGKYWLKVVSSKKYIYMVQRGHVLKLNVVDINKTIVFRK